MVDDPILYAHSVPDGDCSCWEPLIKHLNLFGNAAAENAESFGSEAIARMAGLLHGIGKAKPKFQERLHGKKSEVGELPGVESGISL